MLKFLGLLLLLGVCIAEDDGFKNCSQIPFCAKFRDLTLNDAAKFSADIDNITELNNVASVPLSNGNNEKLVLQITLLENAKIRIEIGEENNKRFKLKDGWALSKAPTSIASSVKVLTTNIARVADKSGMYIVNITRGPPFVLEVYRNKHLQIVLNGDRLIMENTANSQAYAFDVEFEDVEKLYGLFDHSYKLVLGETADHSSEPFRMKNADASAFVPYPADSTLALYGAVAAVYGHSATLTSGVYLHNGAEQWIDISYSENRPKVHFMVESAALDLFLLLGPTPKDVVRQFTGLTGTFSLPQLWTLGFHQCRMTYHSQEDVKTVVAKMQEYKIPMDAIWLARDHTDDNRWFRWNETSFSDPVEMMQNISAVNKKCVPISDPHFKVDENYIVYTEAKKNHYFVKLPNGDDFEGTCWPGLSSWIDFFMPSAASFYGSWYHYDKWNHTTPVLAGIWNDMNEPAVFNGTETTASSDLVHRIDDEGTEVVHRDVHNLYGLMHVKATYQGLLERDNHNKRPFILTRSHFAGSQRYAAMWTGDNSDTWQHFANSFSQCMTANLLGMAMCGPDVGGFFGNTSQELAQRWFQAGAWLPFYRAHSNSAASRREPYLYPTDVRDLIRTAIEVRYRHIPYFYTLFYEHSITGDPVISPLFYHYPGVHGNDTQMLVGTDIMPVLIVNESVTEIEIFFPPHDNWYRIDALAILLYEGGTSQTIEVDITSSPVFYRSGSIIPVRETIKLSTGDYTADDPFGLVVCLNSSKKAYGRFYMDDYTGFGYRNDNYYYYVGIHANGSYNDVTLQMSFISGNSSNFHPKLDVVSIHDMEISDKGLSALQKKYTKTRNGVLLSSIDVGEEIRKSKDGRLVLHL